MRFQATVFYLIALFLLTSQGCRKSENIVDPSLINAPPSLKKIGGKIIIPSSVTFSAQDIRIISLVDDHGTIYPNGTYTVEVVQNSLPQIILVQNKVGNTYLIGYVTPTNLSKLQPIDNQIDSRSTALALVMLNPNLAGFDGRSREQIAENIQKDSRFSELVTIIENRLLSSPQNPIDSSQTNMFEMAGAILNDNIQIYQTQILAKSNSGNNVKKQNFILDDNSYISSIDLNLDILHNPKYVNYTYKLEKKSGNDYSAIDRYAWQGIGYRKKLSTTYNTPINLSDGESDFSSKNLPDGDYRISCYYGFGNESSDIASNVINSLDMTLALMNVFGLNSSLSTNSIKSVNYEKLIGFIQKTEVLAKSLINDVLSSVDSQDERNILQSIIKLFSESNVSRDYSKLLLTDLQELLGENRLMNSMNQFIKCLNISSGCLNTISKTPVQLYDVPNFIRDWSNAPRNPVQIYFSKVNGKNISSSEGNSWLLNFQSPIYMSSKDDMGKDNNVCSCIINSTTFVNANTPPQGEALVSKMELLIAEDPNFSIIKSYTFSTKIKVTSGSKNSQDVQFYILPNDFTTGSNIKIESGKEYYVKIRGTIGNPSDQYFLISESNIQKVRLPKYGELLPINLDRAETRNETSATVRWSYFGDVTKIREVQFHSSLDPNVNPDLSLNSSTLKYSYLVQTNSYLQGKVSNVSSIVPQKRNYLQAVLIPKNTSDSKTFSNVIEIQIHKSMTVPPKVVLEVPQRTSDGKGATLTWSHNIQPDFLAFQVWYSESDPTIPSPTYDSNTKMVSVPGQDEQITINKQFNMNKKYYFKVVVFNRSNSYTTSNIQILDIDNRPRSFILDQKLQGHSENINCLAITQDGNTFASASSDKSIILWNYSGSQWLKSSELIEHSASVNSISFNSTGDALASGSRDSTIKIFRHAGNQWNVQTTLYGFNDGISSVCFNNKDGSLAGGSYDGKIRIYKENGNVWNESQIIADNTDGVLAVSFSLDGKVLATASRDQTIKIYKNDGSSWKIDKDISELDDYASSLAINNDGTEIAYGMYKEVKIWSKSTGTWKQMTTLDISDVPKSNSIFYTSDGSTLAVGASDIKIWKKNASNQFSAPQQVLNLGQQTAIPLVFSPDASSLFSGSDNDINVWTLK